MLYLVDLYLIFLLTRRIIGKETNKYQEKEGGNGGFSPEYGRSGRRMDYEDFGHEICEGIEQDGEEFTGTAAG